jgi:class 3 adenylate cyclase
MLTPRTVHFMVGERLNRKLAAILAADVVGYSRLMGPTRRARWPL